MTVLRQAASAALFRKNVVFDIYLNHQATADAALLIVGFRVIDYLWRVVLDGRGFSLLGLVLWPVGSLMVWIVRAGVCLLVGKLLFRKDSRMATIMRLQGFSYLPLVLTFLPGSIGLIGILWFLALLVFTTAEAMELTWWESAATIAVSVVGLYILSPLIWGAYRLF